MIAFEGLSLMLLNFLRIPPGTYLRKNYGTGKNGTVSPDDYVSNNDLINTMIEITADDVAIGSEPFYYKYSEDIPEQLRLNFDGVCDAFNDIARWVAKDLLKRGYSIYHAVYNDEDKKLVFIPVLRELEFYLDKFGRLVVIDEDGTILDKGEYLIFCFFEKESMSLNEEWYGKKGDKEYEITVTPTPIQLKNVSTVAKDLYVTQRSILRYRSQLSRIVRLVTVDVGLSQGNMQQGVIDTVGEAVNADSNSLIATADTGQAYDDNIPILPNRRGVGKPEIVSDVPSANIGELTDLDNLKSDLSLAMRFPKTYADFSQAIGDTAASTLRGDVRYSRMTEMTRSLMEKTVNHFLSDVDKEIITTYEVMFYLTQYPKPEDEDVISAVTSFKDFLDETFELVIKNSETRLEAQYKVQMLEDLLGSSTNIPSIQDFLQDLKECINKYPFDGTGEGDDNGDIDEIGREFDLDSGEGSDTGGEAPEEPGGEPVEVELPEAPEEPGGE